VAIANIAVDTHADAVNEEVVYQNPLLFLKIWEIGNDTDVCGFPEQWRWHYHKEVEFLAVVEGALGVQSKRSYTVLEAGDVMLLGSSQPHRSHKSKPDPLRYVVFQVDLSKHFDQTTMPFLHCFSELTRPLDDLNYVFGENAVAKRDTYALIMDIFNESQTQAKGYELAISAAVKRLLLLLLRSDTRGVLNAAEEAGIQRLRPVLDDVDARLREKLTVEDASALMNMSYHYFIKYFKKTMGVSFLDYVNYKRIKKAERLLLTTELGATDVGYEVGIANMAQFYKLFKRYNRCSPKEFRQRMRRAAGAGSNTL